MKNDPREIAAYLVKVHGLEGAFEKATKGIATANQNEDFYDLSVWREVKVVLRNMEASGEE